MNWGMTMRNALFGLAICTVLIAALPVIYALSPALSLVAVLIVPAFFLYVFDVGSAIAARFSTGTKPLRFLGAMSVLPQALAGTCIALFGIGLLVTSWLWPRSTELGGWWLGPAGLLVAWFGARGISKAYRSASVRDRP